MKTDIKLSPKKDYLLRESIDNVKKILGNELETIMVERATVGIFFSGVKLSCGHGGL